MNAQNMTTEFPLFWIPLLPLLGAAFNLILTRAFPARWQKAIGGFVACTTVGVACAIAFYAVLGPLFHHYRAAHAAGEATPAAPLVNQVYSWILSGSDNPGTNAHALTINIRFLLDPLSGVMIAGVTFVGFLIHVYSLGYMGHDRRFVTYFGYLNLFTGAMLILVLGDSLPVMFIGWEGVGLCSYLLIGFWYAVDKNASAGKKAFIVNRIGDFAFLIGIFILWSATYNLNISDMRGNVDFVRKLSGPLLHDPFGMSGAFWVALLLFGGAIGKSAQFPLYVWLPDAMAGPTPVSALIHAATMVTAGVYMVARMSFVYLMAPQAMMVVAGVGAFTALFAALIGFAQNDIKRVLAYSTVSQLGFMFVGVGTAAFSAGIFHLFTHAFFKAGLFLAAGSVMHAMGDRTDIQLMGGLRRKIPVTHICFLVYCLAITGLPPLSGFFSKDDILLAAFSADLPGWPAWYGKLLWGVLTLAALGTAFYMWRLYFLVFWGTSRADADTQAHIHESPRVMTAPLVVLAVGTALLGLLGLPGKLNFFADWISRVDPARLKEAHHPLGTMITLMGLATGLAIVGIAVAAALYRNGPPRLGLAWLRKVLANKFYVDEIYDLTFVKLFKILAAASFHFVDRILIDGFLVGVWGVAATFFSRVALALQNGDVQRYMAAMLVGLALLLHFSTCTTGASFTTQPEGPNTVRTVANLGDGVEGQTNTKVGWDFNDDGKIDDSGQTAVHQFPKPGTYKVVLHLTDMFGHEKTVKRDVQVGAAAAGGGK